MHVRRAWLPFLLVPLAFSGCLNDPDTVENKTHGRDDSPNPTPYGPAPGTSADDPATGEMRIKTGDFYYQPEEVWVARGTEVIWYNQAMAVHTATADDGSWDSGRIEGGREQAVTFDEEGSWPYHCEEHPDDMKGVVHVVAPDGTNASA